MIALHAVVETHNGEKWIEYKDSTFLTPYGTKEPHPFAYLSGHLIDFFQSKTPHKIKQKGFPEDSKYLNSTVPIYGEDEDGDKYIKGLISRKEDLQQGDTRNGFNYVLLSELLFDYTKTFINPYDNTEITYEEFLGTSYMLNIQELIELGESDKVRLIYFFY